MLLVGVVYPMIPKTINVRFSIFHFLEYWSNVSTKLITHFDCTLISSLVVMLNVVKYVWNENRPIIDQIEKKQIKISITEPQDFLKGMLHF